MGIENDTDAANNIALFRERITVVAASSLAPFRGPLGEPPPFGDLTEGNLSQWALEAYRDGLPVNPGVRLGQGSAPMAGRSFLTGVLRRRTGWCCAIRGRRRWR